MNQTGYPALLMVDTIASLATMPFEMDAWRVDVAVCGSQKGLMTPPGLSFVAAGERAMAAHPGANLRTRYWDWTERQGEEHYQKYCGTPPEHMLFGLDAALKLLRQEGMENVYRRHRLLAVAQTLADLAASPVVDQQHLAEALVFRSLERSVARDGGLDPGLAGRTGVAAD